MDFEGIEVPEDLEIRVMADTSYRNCTTCGAECMPEPSGADGLGVRVLYVCTEHGVSAIVDPFSHLR